MIIRPAEPSDEAQLVELIAQFRVTLARFRDRVRQPDPDAASSELASYQNPRYRMFVAEIDADELVGYLVCRVEEDVVWAESLFVTPEHRRQGIGTALYQEAEALAEAVGSETVYNWVHPNNDRIIRFLQRRGYTVLNLIELRARRDGEAAERRVRVGAFTYDY
ncbi:MAG: GNAT family N-acetyltransferase [Candidatus Promineifilaceae bacterium]|nr:GNAT family N-acetyltransferase [Candidatus Promineifilaceae bacterium]